MAPVPFEMELTDLSQLTTALLGDNRAAPLANLAGLASANDGTSMAGHYNGLGVAPEPVRPRQPAAVAPPAGPGPAVATGHPLEFMCWRVGSFEVSLFPVVFTVVQLLLLMPLMVPGRHSAWWAFAQVCPGVFLLAIMPSLCLRGGRVPAHLGFGRQGDERAAVVGVWFISICFLAAAAQGASMKWLSPELHLVGHQSADICLATSSSASTDDEYDDLVTARWMCQLHGRALNNMFFAIGSCVLACSFRYKVREVGLSTEVVFPAPGGRGSDASDVC